MDLRFECKWASYEMTPRRYISAVDTYNAKLAQEFAKDGKKLLVKKTAHALMERLAEIEAHCIERMITGNFKCALSADLTYI